MDIQFLWKEEFQFQINAINLFIKVYRVSDGRRLTAKDIAERFLPDLHGRASSPTWSQFFDSSSLDERFGYL